MNDYVCEHLEDLKQKSLRERKNRIKTELDILYHERMLLTYKVKDNENDKRRIY